jgi:hypothetical protein
MGAGLRELLSNAGRLAGITGIAATLTANWMFGVEPALIGGLLNRWYDRDVARTQPQMQMHTPGEYRDAMMGQGYPEHVAATLSVVAYPGLRAGQFINAQIDAKYFGSRGASTTPSRPVTGSS